MAGEIAEAITQVIEGLRVGGDLRALFEQHGVRTPQCPAPPSDEVAVVYTDLEPDDIFAILCIRKVRPVSAVVFTVDREKKDTGSILEKKLVMAATAFGLDFMASMVIVESPSDQEKASDLIRSVAEAASTVFWYVLAPGRGNLTVLLRSPCQSNRVFLYSGSFNTREPNMHASDVNAIAALANPLTDLASFVFTAGHPRLRSLAALWPEVGEDCLQVNPWFAQAWRIFALEFNACLIHHQHPKLFKEPLAEDEKRLLKSIGELSTQEYCRELIRGPLASKLAGYKVSTVRALAEGLYDGPLCDALVPLAETYDVELKCGFWVLDPKTGHTRVDDVTGLCPVMSPMLRGGAAASVDDLKEELRMRVLHGLALIDAVLA
eukprot:CAMPEP_0115484776 /NCGR_PEP_ID=MMETSP0271-20121206/59566_1 /TAXON_ID=71861 /ORGANISM="Scrippsiella trochoidea, Strain CCMP3099" /LENGTH=377 /DNA_ID=CAMNT_0002912709 /DNA_START=1 /DNA_END=1134 /DNA_ORIENTATION=+